MLPPLTSLKLFGLVCPCLEPDSAARSAAWSLSAVRVRWRRAIVATAGASSVSGSVSGFFSSVFSSNSSASAGANDVEHGATEGMLTMTDTSNGPSLKVDADICIPLRHIQSINANATNGIEIQPNEKSEEATIEIEILNEDGGEADESSKNEVLDNLQILLEWERRRQESLAEQGISEEDQYPESAGSKSNILSDKAKKIQHFAQREIELQKTKREREARKAKYVKDAGGLKYTAIAMANRS